MIRVLNLHKSHPVHQEEIADGIATLVIVLFHTDAIAHFLARELFHTRVWDKHFYETSPGLPHLWSKKTPYDNICYTLSQNTSSS